MSIMALKMGAVRKYVSQFDTAKDEKNGEPTVWLIGTLDGRITGRIRDKATTLTVNTKSINDEVETNINTNEMHFEACLYGLRGWENFKDEKGNDIPFKTKKMLHGGQQYQVVDVELLRSVPQIVLAELGMEIMKENMMSDDEGNA